MSPVASQVNRELRVQTCKVLGKNTLVDYELRGKSEDQMEQTFVAWAKMRARRLPQVDIGIGDDAAVLGPSEHSRVVTTDTLMDGIHFDSATADLAAVGRKLVNANLSDLCAMAAEPEAVFLSMCLPPVVRTNAVDVQPLIEIPRDVAAAAIYEGVCDVCETRAIALAGGDTNCWDGPLVLSMTAIGRIPPGTAWRRSGARPDDYIVVTGGLGGSLLGKHLSFEPRIDLVEKLRGCAGIHAAMDVSDGLSVDLLRMCDSSRCGAIVDLDSVPLSGAATEAASNSGRSPVEHALADGEDFELLFAVAPDAFDSLASMVGEQNFLRCGVFTSRTGLWANEGGKIRQLPSTGYIHGK